MAKTPIIKSEGTTKSERYLAKLAEQSFLELWSYPNVFVKPNKRKPAKELCDILVVCGNDIFIFSDKTIGYPSHSDENIAWERWYNKAVRNSVKQVQQAARKINSFPDFIFLDKKCTQKLPLKLPPKDKRRVHGIVVALGASEARKNHKGDNSSLSIEPLSKNKLFTIGDENPDGIFVHILDDVSLDIIMNELDTVTDFTQYLIKKEKFIRSPKRVFANGEEDLVAYYMWHLNDNEEHDFVIPEKRKHEVTISIQPRCYWDWISEPQYKAMKKENKISIFWDQIINIFAQEILEDTISDDITGEILTLSSYERGLRNMALVPRFLRREYSNAFTSHLKQDKEGSRLIINEDTGGFTGYFLLILNYNPTLHGGYENYIQIRMRYIETYAASYLQKHSNLKSIIGIVRESLLNWKSNAGGSYGVIYQEQGQVDLKELKKRQKELNIFQNKNPIERKVQANEYPQLSMNPDQNFKIILGGNNEKMGRNEPCFCGSGKKYKKCCLA